MEKRAKAEAKAKENPNHVNQNSTHMDFTDLTVWKKAVKLLLEIYKLTKKFPPEERYGLSQDMRRAANSVAHILLKDLVALKQRIKQGSTRHREEALTNSSVKSLFQLHWTTVNKNCKKILRRGIGR